MRPTLVLRLLAAVLLCSTLPADVVGGCPLRCRRARVVPQPAFQVVEPPTKTVSGGITYVPVPVKLNTPRAFKQALLRSSAVALDSTAPAGLPNLPTKPTPVSNTFKGCPPDGNGGDLVLNRLKNRVDVAPHWIPVRFQAVADLHWPDSVNRKDREEWDPDDTRQISQYEGMPIAVEGYLAGVRREGKERCNCQKSTADMVDYHLWLTEREGEGKADSIVVEVTPRIRAQHPKWTVKNITAVVDAADRVRISGWLMLDQEHPEQLGKHRGTLWEVHPILKIEVQRDGKWQTLDELEDREDDD